MRISIAETLYLWAQAPEGAAQVSPASKGWVHTQERIKSAGGAAQNLTMRKDATIVCSPALILSIPTRTLGGATSRTSDVTASTRNLLRSN
jgi:hypothetical protein